MLARRFAQQGSRIAAVPRKLALAPHHAARFASSLPDALSRPRGLWIDGEEVGAEAGGTIELENPATLQTITTVADGQAADVQAAVDSAEAAFDGGNGAWPAMQARDRARVLNKAAELLRANMPELAAVEALSTGRPLREYQMQLGRVPEWLEYHAAVAQSAEGSLSQIADAGNHAGNQIASCLRLLRSW